ncbi:MBL fold metallo-hydrolase [Phenylobacterium sp.]|jgi:ribonuclease BN (tRNA processing enzyme)|uniref:MBL fold metallo-hydrolase n=1 Tax=Phenylobacterium sp. TaxID=1871053 RepID=UPI001206F663|nr:MBL fold metallo-hydrolase [Phenylobacterium sp.]THD64535.1 MAG: MBL fold metallo-hydrolase [Phenylobacterium sp.]
MDAASATRRGLLAGGGAALAMPCGGLAQAAAGRSRLILLGTAGGPSPKPNRAAPANAIVVDGATYVIDCGNGVARQMALAGLSLGSIGCVFVTHQHSDHNADYGNLLLLAWATNLTTRVETYGPPPLREMTRLFLELNAYDIKTRMADEGRPPLKDLIAPHEITAGGLVMQDGRVKVTAALVRHPPVEPALAYRFDCPDRSIVFSGDTQPSENLVALAKGADVLVHEVMYLPALERLIAAEPNAKTLREHLLASHTSAQDVGRIAAEAGVKTLVLSHFVPGGLPAIPDETWAEAVRPHFAGRIVVGRDLMEL